ncbi:OLC1v1003095C1 [Oldenlandia corymbosa var. corymbosa]|uniref:OLC1v1003095C1 n=1 Tax=Oldenlandia corymbosa var. corymbosa TaxID=529605 RepID=A0AAV1DCN2_OLDCO|nr:OLC1v1003095C1 [Oldenlandia corymbosa var. corymbosa]
MSSAQMQKLVSSIEIKLDGNVFHEIFRERPYHLPKMSPKHVRSIELCDGEWGKVGSVVRWNFVTPDGKKAVSKDIIEAIDVEKKSVTYRVIERDILAAYKTFAFIIDVDKVGDKNVVTWSIEYEKQDESIPDPHGLIKLCHAITKDIEAYHLNQ